MSANELAMICGNRWVSSDHICWLMKTLNMPQSDTYFVYLNNDVCKNPKTKPFEKLSKICMAMNVGKDIRGNTFLGTYNRPGNHWTLCHVDTIEKKILYGDSLGWKVPDSLLDTLADYIKAVNIDDSIEHYNISILHDPTGKCPKTGAHKCNQKCAQNYPLQTCSDVCGIVVMAMAAIACHRTGYFMNLTTVYPTTSESLPTSYLTNPTRFSKYLRLVMGCWIARNEVKLSNIVPQYWHQDHNSKCQLLEDTTMNNYSGNDNGRDESGSVQATQEECTHEPSSASDKLDEKKDNTTPNNKEQHKCTTCGLLFSRKFTLKRHIAKMHPNLTDNYSDGNCVCRTCGFKCHMIKTLQEHLAKEHSVVLEKETILLESRTGKFL